MRLAAHRRFSGGFLGCIPVRTRLVLLILAATLPLLLFAAGLVAHAYLSGTELLRGNAMGLARASMLAIEREVGRAEAALVGLSTSSRLDRREWDTFDAKANQVLEGLGMPGASIVVADRSGRVLYGTASGFAGAQASMRGTAIVERVFETGQAQVSDVYLGARTREPRVSVDVPVLRDGRVVLDLGISIPPRVLTDVLLAQRLPGGWLGSVFDRAGVTVARTLDPAAQVGQPGAPGLRDAIAAAPEGFNRLVSREGMPVFTAHARSERTGWTATVAVPAGLVSTPLWRTIGLLAGGGALLVLLSAALAWGMGRGIAVSLEELARRAGALGRGEGAETLGPPLRGVVEAEQAGRALADAAVLLSLRERALLDLAARLEQDVATRTRDLAASEARFRSYFDHAAEPMFVVRVESDGSFTYETLNQADVRLTGLKPEEFEERRPDACLPPETARLVLARYRECVATGEPMRYTHVIELPSGMRELDTVLVPVRDPDTGRVTRIIGGLRDQTERRKLEDQLRHAQRMEAVGQLTGGVAHDFNNLLTIVSGNLGLLAKRVAGDERAARYLDAVRQAVERGGRLTASLLAFSRRQALQPQALDLAALLGDSATLLRRALGETVRLELRVPDGLPRCHADAGQLEAAVLNLAINARDAMPDGGILRIEAGTAVLDAAALAGNEDAQPGRYVSVAVSDTGAGMAPDVAARAFEPFFTTKEVGRGTGLGLSQVYGFVRQVGGHVTLGSAPGAGTRVTLYLPVADLAAAAGTDAAAAPPVVAVASATLLLVEDDPELRAVTAEVLRDAGFRVLTAADAAAALGILRGREAVDILFSDVVMPGGMRGPDLAREARALRPDLAVLLTTGYAGAALDGDGTVAGFEMIQKPYDRATLVARLGALAGEGRRRA